MAAGSIIIDLLMRTGSFETDTKRAEKRLKDFEKNVAATTRGIVNAFTGIGAAIAGAIGIGSIQQFAASVLNELDALNDVADATGATVETISALESVALRTGASLDTVSTSLLKFNQVLNQAKEGSEAADVLKAIGLNAEELKRIDPAEALRQTAVALSQFADDGNKARAVQILFGKSVAEVAPFLKDLAEQTRLVGTVTTEQAQAAERFNKSLFELKAQVTDLSRDLGGPLIEALNRVAKSFKDSEAAGDSFFKRIVRGQLALLGNPFGLGIPDNPNQRRASGTVQPAAPAPGSLQLPNAELQKYLEGLQKQIDLTKKVTNVQKAQAEIASGALGKLTQEQEKQVLAAAKALDVAAARNAPRSPARATVNLQSEADRYLESLQRQLERTKELTVTEQLLTDIQAGRLGKVTAAQQAALVGIAEQIDAVKRQQMAEDERTKALETQRREFEAIQQQGQAIYDATRTPLERLNVEQARLNDLLQKGAIDWDTYSRAVFAAQDAYDATAAKAAETGNELNEFAKNAAENIQSSLGDSLFEAMNGRFKNIGDAFNQLIQRMVAEALAAKITESLFGKGGTGGLFGGILGDFGKILGLGGGSSNPGRFGEGGPGLMQTLGSFFGGFKAVGGDVMPNRSYMVGEQGPEMFVPRTAGTIIPAGPTATMGRQTTINAPINVAVSGAVDKKTREQIAMDVRRAVEMAAMRGTA